MDDTASTSAEPPPWFIAAGAAPFLAVGSGESYLTDIVRADQIVEIMVEWCEGEGADPERVGAITEQLADEDNWWSDPDFGPCVFKSEVGETGHIAFYRLEGHHLVGAIASQAGVEDPAAECPLMHILHPENAGSAPVLLYARLPRHMVRLAHG